MKLEKSLSMIYPTLYKLGQRGKLNLKWIGWPGYIPQNVEEKLKINELLSKENCIPVWIDKELVLMYQLFIEKYL